MSFSRPMRQLRIALRLVPRLAALVFGLNICMAGCSNGSRVTPGYVNPGAWEFARGVMAKGPLLVRVSGTPYAAPRQVIDARIEHSMQQALTWYANPRFSTDPASAVGGSFFVSLIFNTGYVGASQCALQSNAGGAPQSQGAIQLSAAFCDGDELLATAAGSLPHSTGIDDPVFAFLLGEITRSLFATPPLHPWPRGIGIGL